MESFNFKNVVLDICINKCLFIQQNFLETIFDVSFFDGKMQTKENSKYKIMSKVSETTFYKKNISWTDINAQKGFQLNSRKTKNASKSDPIIDTNIYEQSIYDN